MVSDEWEQEAEERLCRVWLAMVWNLDTILNMRCDEYGLNRRWQDLIWIFQDHLWFVKGGFFNILASFFSSYHFLRPGRH